MRLSFALLITAVSLSAQSRFTIDQVMSAPFASSPLMSPAGDKVVWLLNEQGRRNIWIASAPEWKGRKLTAFNDDDGQEIDDLGWAPDAKLILFARGGDFENGGANPNPDVQPQKPDQSIWSVAADGSPAKKLTEGRATAVAPTGDLVAFTRDGHIYTMSLTGQGVGIAVRDTGTDTDLRWSPDGQHLAFTSRRQDHSVIGIYTPAAKSLRYIDGSSDFDSAPVWSADGGRLAYIRVPSEIKIAIHAAERTGDPWSIRTFDLQHSRATQIFRADPGPGSVYHGITAQSQLTWTGDRITFAWEKTGWCHLYTVDINKTSAPVELTAGAGEIEHLGLSPDRKSLFYSTNIGDIDRRHLWRLDLTSMGKPVQVTAGEGIEWEPAPTNDPSTFVYLTSTFNQRSHAVIQTAKTKSPVVLAPETVPAGFPEKQLVHPQPVTVTAADGLELHGQLFLPSDKTNRHPALVFFHGGSRRQMLLGFHYRPYYSNAYAMNQFLASQGYVVLSVNYRSGIGYGLNFREALSYGPSGGSEFNDVIGAGLYLKSRTDVDPRRIGVWGGSYGGYLTAMALSRAPDLFAAGVDFHGVHDWSAFLNAKVNSGDPSQQQQLRETSRIAFESSPMASIDTWRAPVLLIHGDDDRNVPFAQTVMLADALRKRNVPYEELILPDEIHDFLLHRHWLEAYRATADFFARKLNGSSEDRGTR